MKNESNREKSIHGQKTKDALLESLKELKKMSYIKSIETEFRCGYANFNRKQFYANYLITFFNGKQWILYTTASCRTDRVKGNQWDSYNIKKINKNVEKSVLVYPDYLDNDERLNFVAYATKIYNSVPLEEIENPAIETKNYYYSAIDYVVDYNELFELIENYANEDIMLGQKKDSEGKNFEKHIVNILNNKENLKKWKDNNETLVGTNYKVFKQIVDFFELNKNKTYHILATNDNKDIGHLKTSGKPKTDVIIKVYDESKNEQAIFTVSCKKTKAKGVSVHQYSADDFADALDPSNTTLKELLNDFQKNGTLKDFGEEKIEKLTLELKPYLRRLTEWVLSGRYGKITDESQIANYLFVSDGSKIYIHAMDEYIDILLASDEKGHFGTPFNWTFASKSRGKNIQLKCRILK